MIRVKVVCIGSIKEKYVREHVQEFEKRLSKFCKLELKELPETRIYTENNPAEVEKALEKESQLILEAVPKNSFLIPLCIEGQQLSSQEFSEKLSQIGLNGKSEIAFIIGSSHGLSQKVKQKGDFLFSLSKMTFPHQLFRVMLLEQIYRGFTIENNIKYHK